MSAPMLRESFCLDLDFSYRYDFLNLVSLDVFECCSIAERCNRIHNDIGAHEAEGILATTSIFLNDYGYRHPPEDWKRS